MSEVLLKSRWHVVHSVGHWSCDRQIVGSTPGRVLLCSNTGQVIQTTVTSSITWYWPKASALWLARQLQTWHKFMAAYRNVYINIPVGWLLGDWKQRRALHSTCKYGSTFPFTSEVPVRMADQQLMAFQHVENYKYQSLKTWQLESHCL